MGLPATARGATTPEQIYDYLLGAYFGANEKPWTVHKAGKIWKEKVQPAAKEDIVVKQTMDAEIVKGLEWKKIEPEVQKELKKMAHQATGGTYAEHSAAAWDLAQRQGLKLTDVDKNMETHVFKNYRNTLKRNAKTILEAQKKGKKTFKEEKISPSPKKKIISKESKNQFKK